MILRTFGLSFAVTAAALIWAFFTFDFAALVIVTVLIVLEVSLSFDNAVVNATILKRLSPWWQKFFLTVGILIAVFGMRLLFPLVLVAVTAGLGPIEVFQLALDNPEEYAARLDEAHPSIAAFGGIFLYMLFLDFVLDPEREIRWLTWLERPLAKVGKLDVASVVIALSSLLLVAGTFGSEHAQEVLFAGVAGLATYLGVRGMGEYFETHGVLAEIHDEEEGVAPKKSGPNALTQATGKAAFFLFLYLELIDASFSFDGVVGAFAVTQNIFIIAIGLGVGAMYIRSLTVYLVRKGTLDEYVYLEHGAHWAIGALAVLLGVSIAFHVPEVVTGLIGVGFILAALISSILVRKKAKIEGVDVEELVLRSARRTTI